MRREAASGNKADALWKFAPDWSIITCGVDRVAMGEMRHRRCDVIQADGGPGARNYGWVGCAKTGVNKLIRQAHYPLTALFTCAAVSCGLRRPTRS